MDIQATSTIKELAAHFSVSVSTARKWVRSGKIPPSTYIHVDAVYRFDLKAIQAVLTAANTADKQKDTEHE